MKNKVALFFIAVLFVGCAQIESSALMYEKAVVVTTIHSPSEHHTEITQTAYTHTGKVSTGTDFHGRSGHKIGNNLQVTSITTIKEKNGVVFQCQHGTFTVEGADPKYKVLSQKLSGSVKDTVDIIYKEKYKVIHKKDDKGLKQEVRVLKKLDFIDAQIIQKDN